MTVLAPTVDRFNKTLDVVVREAIYHNFHDPDHAARNTGKTVHLRWAEPYGTGMTTKHLDVPVGTVVDALLDDPESAEVVLASVAAYLIRLHRKVTS